MSLKTMILAGAAVLSLAAPAAAFADPYWGWRDHDDWRRHEWAARHGWAYGYGPRCFFETRGYRDWYGHWVYRPVRVCR